MPPSGDWPRPGAHDDAPARPLARLPRIRVRRAGRLAGHAHVGVAGHRRAGESLRLWASGHLEKSTEVTRSGPYRYTRHPLYLGSSLIGIGFAAGARHLVVALVIVAYLVSTLTAAMRSEEAHLREKFGDAYDAYAEKRAAPMNRPFSWARAIRNREHHTMAGLLTGLGLLAAKVLFRSF